MKSDVSRIKKLNDNHVLLLLWLLLISIIICAYIPIVNSYFVGDDFVIIHHAFKQQTLSFPHFIYSLFCKPHLVHLDNYRPLSYLSYFIDSIIWKTNPTGYHVMNILFHAINTSLVFIVAFRIFSHSRINIKVASFLTALLFAIHPSHSETVTWISSRMDLLMTMFVLLCLYCYLQFLTYSKKRYLYCIPCLYLLGLFSKETAIITPIYILGAFLFYKKKLDTPHLILGSLLLLVLGGYFGLRGYALPQLIGGNTESVSIDYTYLIQHLKSTILPQYYQYRYSAYDIITNALLMLLGCFIVIKFREHRKWQLFIVLIIIAGILPVYGAKGIGLPTSANRYWYLPIVGVTLLWGYNLSRLYTHSRLGKWSVVVGVICMVGLYLSSLVNFHQHWITAGNITHSIKEEIYNYSNEINKGKFPVILNLPHEYKSAHIFGFIGASYALTSPFVSSDFKKPIYYLSNLGDRYKNFQKSFEWLMVIKFFQKLEPLIFHWQPNEFKLLQLPHPPKIQDITFKHNQIIIHTQGIESLSKSVFEKATLQVYAKQKDQFTLIGNLKAQKEQKYTLPFNMDRFNKYWIIAQIYKEGVPLSLYHFTLFDKNIVLNPKGNLY